MGYFEWGILNGDFKRDFNGDFKWGFCMGIIDGDVKWGY